MELELELLKPEKFPQNCRRVEKHLANEILQPETLALVALFCCSFAHNQTSPHPEPYSVVKTSEASTSFVNQFA
jgi:hypothetical protein